MPLLRPVLVLVLVVTVIGSFQVFDTVAVTTQGGPVNATRVIQYLHLPKSLHANRTSATDRPLAVILFAHPRPRGLHPDEVPQGQRVGPGLRSTAMTTTTRSRTVAAPTARRRRPFNWRRAGAWALLVLAIAVSVLPFLWVLRTALSTNGSLATNASNLLPADFTFGAFKRVFGLQTPEEAIAEGGSGAAIDFWLYLRNSIIFSSITTAGAVFFSAMAAYAFARLRWRGRNVVFSLFLATMMVPPIFTALPNFLLIKNLGLLNTMLGMVLPYPVHDPVRHLLPAPVLPEHVPRSGGSGNARRRQAPAHLLPDRPAQRRSPHRHPGPADLHRPVERILLAAAGRPGRIVRVLTVGLGVFKSQSPQGAPDWSGLMAATLVSALPVLILFVAFGKKIVNSIGFSGIK